MVHFVHEGWLVSLTKLVRFAHVSRRRATIRSSATIVRAFGTTIREHGVRAIVRSFATIVREHGVRAILRAAYGQAIVRAAERRSTHRYKFLYYIFLLHFANLHDQLVGQ